VLYYGIFHRVSIIFKGDSLTVVRSPIPLPSSYRVSLADIREIDTHVKIVTHRDKHGNEHESYRFTVQLSLISDWRPRRLYRTSSEPAAVLFRQTLAMMLDNARAMNRG
jgi:arylamine N-acetyltransferase